jgi:hypothetical protein
MSSRVLGLRVAGTVFAIVCIAHIWRLLTHTAVIIGGTPIPSWPSVFAAIFSGALSLWIWKLASGPA